jgi:hypothetical protein
MVVRIWTDDELQLKESVKLLVEFEPEGLLIEEMLSSRKIRGKNLCDVADHKLVEIDNLLWRVGQVVHGCWVPCQTLGNA